MFGFRPFNHLIEARDHYLMNSISVGEGYHNFHHAFPFDYRSAEDGAWFNTTKWLIDVGALLGQVYNRKVLPSYLATARKEKVQRLILAAKNTEHNHP
jgi:stearoyl-CoA desaturase (delta-9 desaturase)